MKVVKYVLCNYKSSKAIDSFFVNTTACVINFIGFYSFSPFLK